MARSTSTRSPSGIPPWLFGISLSSLCWTCLVMASGQVQATDVSGAANWTTDTLVVNITDLTPPACPEAYSCGGNCGGALAGAVIGSLLLGTVLGAVIMFFTQRYLNNRKKSVPPKDYCESQSSALDVNMNNGERAGEPTEAVTSETGPQVKVHKKLERLSKQGMRPTPAPKPILGLAAKPHARSSAEAPLIYIGPRNNDEEDNLTKSDIGKPPLPPPNSAVCTVEPDSGVGDSLDGSEQDTAEMPYINIGLDAALSQPYDSLDVIPEEVEYANTQEYEQIGLVSRG